MLDVTGYPDVTDLFLAAARLITDPTVAAQYAARYEAWRERFNAHDDGAAAQRVLAHLVELGAVR